MIHNLEIVRKTDGEIFLTQDSPQGRVEVATVHKASEYGPLPVEENAKLLAMAPAMRRALVAVYQMRSCPIVDDDFPHLRDRADWLTREALQELGILNQNGVLNDKA
jgi:hypothetical protein